MKVMYILWILLATGWNPTDVYMDRGECQDVAGSYLFFPNVEAVACTEAKVEEPPLEFKKHQ